MKNSKSLNLAKKYLGKKVTATVDRPLGSKHPRHDFIYEVNYGYIKGVKAPDGEDLDVYILGVEKPVKTICGICIAIVHRNDDDDDKLVVVPDKNFKFRNTEIMKMVHFQEQWFDSIVIREE